MSCHDLAENRLNTLDMHGKCLPFPSRPKIKVLGSPHGPQFLSLVTVFSVLGAKSHLQNVDMWRSGVSRADH